jgi:HlyD family type I secretion membrane fusion protein
MTEAVSVPDIRWPIRGGLAVIAATIAALSLWAALAPLSAAVIASGHVKSDSNRKSVQHLEGGIVRRILVRDGDQVDDGQVLIELASTEITATATVYGGQLDAREARAARLRAERDDASEIELPAVLAARAAEPEVNAFVDSEQRVFDSGRTLLENQQRLLAAQIEQIDAQIAALDRQIEAEHRASRLMQEELDANRSLHDKGFVNRPHLLSLERELENYRAAISEHTAESHAARQRRFELDLRRQNAAAERRQRAAVELAGVEAEIDDLLGRTLAAQEAVSRLLVRAPIGGTVVDLKVFTVGGVVAPGQPVMDILPTEDALVVEAMADVRYADDLREGLPVHVHFSGLPARDIVPLAGVLDYVSADRVEDSRTGEPHFVIRAHIARDELGKLPVSVKAGMPVEVFVQLGERSALDYLLSPLTHNLRRALREP